MTALEIHESLDSMLKNPKSKNFLGHLIKNYIPTTNVKKILIEPKGTFKCVLTRVDLLSVDKILNTIETEEYKREFNEYLNQFLDKSFSGETPIGKLLGEKKMGFTGKDTTTYMSFTALQEFYNWVLSKSLIGDKHINWVLGSVRNNFYPRQESVRGITTSAIKTTYKLGNVSGFEKLKNKFN